jgi:hypothetical protein
VPQDAADFWGFFMRSQTIAQGFAAVLLSLGLAACGGGVHIGSATSSSSGSSSGSSGSSSSSGGSSSGSSSGAAVVCGALSLLASAPQLPSAASTPASGITVSALCKDANNNAVAGSTVSFAANAGLLQVTQPVTDATGTAQAVLSTGGDPTNQNLQIVAKSGASSPTLVVPEVGTNVQIGGPIVVGLGAKVSYTVTVVDSAGRGIVGQAVTLTSSLKNAVTPASGTTDASGRATFSYTSGTSGTDTLTAAAATVNASTSTSVSITASSLTFTKPANPSAPIPFNTPTPVQIQYLQNGSPVKSATINFSVTRGLLYATAPALPCSAGTGTTSALSAVTDASGNASVIVCTDGSQGPVGAIVNATVSGGGPSSSAALSYVSTVAASISIKASPSTIATQGTSTLTATVLDQFNNVVQGQTVDFSLTDRTGGSLSAASATTDASGNASVIYTASTVSSGKDGVVVTARVDGTSITPVNPAKITVGGQALRIVLGTKNVVLPLGNTRYQLPYSVLVTDSAGNPVQNATFNLTVQSIAYQKGFMVFDTVASYWVPYPPSLVPSSDPHLNKSASVNPLTQLPFGCITEDPNNNGIYSPTLDYNQNGVLDPGAVASAPSTIPLDPSTGSGEFEITYPSDHAYWTEVLLTGTAVVQGTETTATATIILPGVATDYNRQNISPPGAISPFGDSANEPATYTPDPTTGVLVRNVKANNCQSPN